MKRIRELRKAKGLTIKQLGASVGVAESTVSLYETGKHQPDFDTLKKIADVLDVSIDYLLERDLNLTTKIQPTVNDDELDNEIVDMLQALTPQELQRVVDFVSGLKASRKE